MSYTFEVRDLSPDQIRAVADIWEHKTWSLEDMYQARIRPVIERGITVDGKAITTDRLVAFEPLDEEIGALVNK